jgi:hypothetical protein
VLTIGLVHTVDALTTLVLHTAAQSGFDVTVRSVYINLSGGAEIQYHLLNLRLFLYDVCLCSLHAFSSKPLAIARTPRKLFVSMLTGNGMVFTVSKKIKMFIQPNAIIARKSFITA